MEGCLTATKEKCGGFAKEKCLKPFRETRIVGVNVKQAERLVSNTEKPLVFYDNLAKKVGKRAPKTTSVPRTGSSPLRILDQLEIDPLPTKQLGQVVCVGSILDLSMHNSTQCVGAHRGVAFHNDDDTEDAVVKGLDERDIEMGKANEGGGEERMG
ncbi:hypothetical protein EV1_017504 [Malus domestica]